MTNDSFEILFKNYMSSDLLMESNECENNGALLQKKKKFTYEIKSL